jgi:hypothetical protein
MILPNLAGYQQVLYLIVKAYSDSLPKSPQGLPSDCHVHSANWLCVAYKDPR